MQLTKKEIDEKIATYVEKIVDEENPTLIRYKYTAKVVRIQLEVYEGKWMPSRNKNLKVRNNE